MEAKLLFVLLASSIVASAFGIRIRLVERNVCISQCGAGAVKTGYEPGWEYSYTYYMSTDSQIGKQTLKSIGISFDANVRIEAITKCQMALHIDKITVEPNNDKEEKKNRNLVYALRKHILYFRFEDGLIDNLCSKDPAWVRNIKRGILSTFHNKIGLPPQSSSGIETDVSGRCPVKYISRSIDKQAYRPKCRNSKCRSYPPRNMADKGLLILTTKDLSKCEKHQQILGGFSASRYESDSLNQQVPITRTANECEHVINNGIITFAFCGEVVETKPILSQNIFPSKMVLSKSLLFLRKSKTTCGSGCRQLKKTVPIFDKYRYHRSNLLFEFHDQIEKTGNLLETTNLLCQASSKEYMYNRPMLFVQLVDKLRTVEGSKIFKARRISCPTASASDVQKTLMDAVQITGTPAAAMFILRSTSLSRREKDKKLSLFFMVKQPTLSLLEYMSRFIRQYKAFPMASKATTALIHRFCLSRNICNRLSTLRSAMAYLVSEVKNSCWKGRKSQFRKHTINLFSMVGNLKLPFPLQRDIVECAKHSKTPTSVAISAVTSLRRSCSLKRDQMLISILNSKKNIEVRLAAYTTLLRCPQPFLHIRIISRLMQREKDPQVASFVKTHVFQMRSTQDPSLQRLRMQMLDLRWRFRFIGALKRPSNYNEHTLYSATMNLGMKTETSRIHEGAESRIRQYSSRFSGFLFGNKIDYFEMNVRREDDDQPSKASSYASFRLFGHDVFESTKIYGIEKYLYMTQTEIALELKKMILKYRRANNSPDIRTILTDTTAKISSSLGLPVTLRLNGAAAMKMKEESDTKSKLAAVMLKPDLNLGIGMEMNVAVKDLTFGIKRTASGHHRSSLELMVTWENKILEIKLATPPQLDLLTLRYDTFYIRRGDEINQRRSDESIVDETVWTFFNFGLEKALGYQLELKKSSIRPKEMLHSYASRQLSLRMIRTDRHKNFVLKAKSRTRKSPTIFLEMDTPGSNVDRRIFGNITSSKHGLDLTLETPWKKLKAEAKLTWKKHPYLNVNIGTEKRKYVDVRLQYKWLTKSKEEMVAIARFGGFTILDAKMSQQRRRNNRQLDLTIRQPFKEPVKFFYHLTRNKQNRISIGKRSQLTTYLKSSFLKSNLSGTLEYSPRYSKSRVIFSYDIPNSDNKGSVGAKLNWNRRKDRIYRDIIKGAISFSQFPDIDLDFSVKSTFISVTNFRNDVLLKVGENKLPVSFMIDFAYRNSLPLSSSLRLHSAYVVQGYNSGLLKVRLFSDKDLLEASTNFKLNSINDKSAEIPILAFGEHFKYHRTTRRLTKGNLMLSGSLLQHHFAVRSAIGDGMNAHVGYVNVSLKKLSEDLEEKDNQPFGLNVRIKPLAAIIRASSFDWSGKLITTVHIRRGIGFSYSFEENSRMKLVGQGAVRYSPRFTRVKHWLTKRSKNVYNITMQASYRRKIPKGIFDFIFGGAKERRRLKISFSNEKRLHTSQLFFQNLKFKTDLSNRYNFDMSLPDVRLNGTSDLRIENINSDRYMYLLAMGIQSKDMATVDANANLQIAGTELKENFGLKIKLKGQDSKWRKADINAQVTSSSAGGKILSLSHSHDLLAVPVFSRSSLNSFGKQFDLHTEGVMSPRFSKLAAVTRFSGGHQIILRHNYPVLEFVNRIPTTSSERQSFLALATSSGKDFGINLDFSQRLDAARFPSKISLSIDPKIKISSEIRMNDFTGTFAYLVASSDFSLNVRKSKPETKVFVDVSTYPEEWKLQVKNLPLKLRATLSRKLCSGSALLTKDTDSDLLKVIASFCDLNKQNLLLKSMKNSVSFRHSAKPNPKTDASMIVNFQYGPIRQNWKALFKYEGRKYSSVPKSSSLVIDLPDDPVKMTSKLSVSDSKAVKFITTVRQDGIETVDLMLNLMNKESNKKSSFKSVINSKPVKSKISTSWEPSLSRNAFLYAFLDHDILITSPKWEFISKNEKDEKMYRYKMSMKDLDRQRYILKSSTNIGRQDMNIRAKLIAICPVGYRMNASFIAGKNARYYSFDANVVRGSTKKYYTASKLSVTALPGFDVNFDCPIFATKVIVTPKLQKLTFGPAYVYKGPQVDRSIPTRFTFNISVERKPKSHICSVNLNAMKTRLKSQAEMLLKIFRNSKEKVLFKSDVSIHKVRKTILVHMRSSNDIMYNTSLTQRFGTFSTEQHQYGRVKWMNGRINQLIRQVRMSNRMPTRGRYPRSVEVRQEESRSETSFDKHYIMEKANYTRSPNDWNFLTYKFIYEVNDKMDKRLDVLLNPQTFSIKAFDKVLGPFVIPHPSGGNAFLFTLSRQFVSKPLPTKKYRNLFFLKTGGVQVKGNAKPISLQLSLDYEPLQQTRKSMRITTAIERFLNHQTTQTMFNVSSFWETLTDTKFMTAKAKLFNNLEKYSLAETQVRMLFMDPKRTAVDVDINLIRRLFRYRIEYRSTRKGQAVDHAVRYIYQKKPLLSVLYTFDEMRQYRRLQLKTNRMRRPLVVSTITLLSPGRSILLLNIGNGIKRDDFEISLMRERMRKNQFSFRITHKPTRLHSGIIIQDNHSNIAVTAFHKHHRRSSTLHFHIIRERKANRIIRYKMNHGFKSITFTPYPRLTFDIHNLLTSNRLSVDLKTMKFLLRHSKSGELLYERGKLTFKSQRKFVLNFQCQYVSSKVIDCSYQYNPQLLFNSMKQSIDDLKIFILRRATIARFIIINEIFGIKLPRLINSRDFQDFFQSLQTWNPKPISFHYLYDASNILSTLSQKLKAYLIYGTRRIEGIAVKMDNEVCVESVRRRLRKLETSLNKYRKFPQRYIENLGILVQDKIDVEMLPIIRYLSEAAAEVYGLALNSIQNAADMLEKDFIRDVMSLNLEAYERYFGIFHSQIKKRIFGKLRAPSDQNYGTELSLDDGVDRPPSVVSEILRDLKSFIESELGTPVIFKRRAQRVLKFIGYELVSSGITSEFKSRLTRIYMKTKLNVLHLLQIWPPSIGVADAQFGRFTLTKYLPNQCDDRVCLNPQLLSNPFKITKLLVRNIERMIIQKT